MAMSKGVRSDSYFMGRLDHGADLLEELTGICRERGIQLGRIEALGAVQKARLGYYDQQHREYTYIEIDQAMEITHLVGNVSVRDGAPMVHAHITLSDRQGRAYGGHLAPGTLVFACEFVVERFEGPAFVRGMDEETGLPLWELKQD